MHPQLSSISIHNDGNHRNLSLNDFPSTTLKYFWIIQKFIKPRQVAVKREGEGICN